jgi:hypothetical protein
LKERIVLPYSVALTRRSIPEVKPPRRNRSVRIAVSLMLLGAALDVAAAVTAITTEPSLVPWFVSHHAGADSVAVQPLVVAQGETQFAFAVAAAACWLLMAYANSRARGQGPRILSAVLLALGLSLLQGSGAPRSAATLTLSVLVCLVGIAAVVLLFGDELRRPLRHRRTSSIGDAGSGLSG